MGSAEMGAKYKEEYGMKKMAIFFVAAALTMSLTACGSRNDTAANDTATTDRYQEGYDQGYKEGYDAAKKEMEAATDNMDPNTALDGAGDDTVGSDMENAVDNAGDAVGDAVGDAGAAVGDMMDEGVGFRRMLDNARVHDRDGDLNDGENSRR